MHQKNCTHKNKRLSLHHQIKINIDLKEKIMTTRESTIVTFREGRGGRFYNGGHITFYGECGIGDVHVIQEHLFPPSYEREDGELIDDAAPDAEWRDCDGNSVELTNAMIDCGIGHINIDNEYDSYYSKYLSDCDENELTIILNDRRDDLVRQYIDEYTDLEVDWERLKTNKWRALIELAFCHPMSIDEEEFYIED